MRKKRNTCENFLRNMTYTIFKSNNNNILLVCLLFNYKERIKKAISIKGNKEYRKMIINI